ncbi:MAG: helix-turn-helix transcriptional regulator [Paenibacillaceae bacterium]|nr:helix-turn-helix transcriptional regulator [Paenibacillaceae bacterium]
MDAESVYRHEEFMEQEFPVSFHILRHHELNVRKHAHDYIQLIYVNKGACTHHLQARKYTIMKGDLLYIPPYVSHAFAPIAGRETEIVQLDFTMRLLGGIAETGGTEGAGGNGDAKGDVLEAFNRGEPKITVDIRTQFELEHTLALIGRELAERRPGFRQIVKAELVKLLLYVGREIGCGGADGSVAAGIRPRRHRKLKEAIVYVNQHYTEELKLSDISRMAGLATGYFCVLFKQTTGQTFVDYVNHLRIRLSMRLIRESDMKIIDIFLSAGFNHIGHFNRMFRKMTGVTPSQYRRLAEGR